MRPAACCQTADHPHQRTMHPVAVENHQAADACAQKCRHSHACENNTHRLDAVLPRQNINADCRQHRADEGHRSNQIFHRREQNHNHHASQTSAGADADNMRVSQRIAHNRLQNRTGKRQVHADQRTHDGTRHTNIPDNLALRIITGSKQNLHNLLQRDYARALCQAQKAAYCCHKQKHKQHSHTPSCTRHTKRSRSLACINLIIIHAQIPQGKPA